MRIFTILFLTVFLSFSAFAQANKKNAQAAETFDVTSIKGDKFDLDELKGKVVVLTFWGTYCQICVSEIPELNKLAANFKNKDVVFLAVSAETEDKIKKFVKKKQFDFNLIPSGFDLMARYADKTANGSFTMPTPMYFVINQNGEIELKTSGRDKTKKLEDTLTRLLNSNNLT